MVPPDRPSHLPRIVGIGIVLGVLAVLAAWRFRAPVARAPESGTVPVATNPVAPPADPTAASTPGPGVSGGLAAPGPQPEQLRLEVVKSFPHDAAAFTQGLLWSDGDLYESTGLNGESSLRRVDLETGKPEATVTVPEQFFAEGLALADGKLFQLTWQSYVGFVYDASTLERTGGFTYETEGWGLCYDGRRLVKSDGSADLTFHSLPDFKEEGRVTVTARGTPQPQLNELECVDGLVYANVWQTDRIVRIDPSSGVVTGEIDASGLLSESERAGADVLNGIAYDPEGERFLVTGKLWPRLFEVRLVPR